MTLLNPARYRHLKSRIYALGWMIFLVMSLLVGYSYTWNIENIEKEQLKLALIEAKSNWNKDAAFRQWATRHGGVYVPPDERTPPNPALAHIPDRDVVTTDGKRLTLMNPAYMMRQMTQEFEADYGIKGKITGKKQLNAINAPDPWESHVLDIFASSNRDEVVEQTDINGEPYLRYMKAMYMTEGCDKCHAILGYRQGDLRGGVSVSIPLAPYFSAAAESARGILATHVIVWMAASLFLLIFTRMLAALFSRMSHDALHDDLTGLPNLTLFKDRVNQAIQRRLRHPEYRFAVCFLDLDRFKDINDSHGHAEGDKLLVLIAKVLDKTLRPTDTVARMGGDEFTLLLDDIGDTEEALDVCQRVMRALETPFQVGYNTLYTAASIGICMTEEHPRSAEEMIRDADIAMYRAKAAGKGRIDIFNREMHAQAQQHLKIETDLRTAIQNQQLEIYYQPVIDIRNNRISGFEALLRWHHPELGNIPPDQFIPVAEHSGQIEAIDGWVLEHACEQVKKWSQAFSHQRPFTLAVNLSGIQLATPATSEKITRTLMHTRFDPKQLHVEVTETMLVSHKETAKQVIERLRHLGISVSIDDFGTGYCSLNYLQEFQFDTLKIDKSFVQDMTPEGRGRQLVRTLMLLAQDLKMDVLAEGVETAEQLHRLQAMNCPYVQGYYFSKPLPVKEVEQLLEQESHEQAEALIQGTDSTQSLP